jgi:hypothetical protein
MKPAFMTVCSGELSSLPWNTPEVADPKSLIQFSV